MEGGGEKHGLPGAAAQEQPPLKRARRTTSDFLKARRQGLTSGGLELQVHSEASDATSSALAQQPQDLAIPSFSSIEPLFESFAGEVADPAKEFEVSQRHAAEARQDRYAALSRRQDTAPQFAIPELCRSEDIACDLTLRQGLRLATPHASLRWLRRLPAALRCQSMRSQDLSKGHVRDAALELCEASLPQLLSDPDKAVAWLARVAACLSWYEVEGPLLPSIGSESIPTASMGTAVASAALQKEAQRRVEEWDESYRSLWLLMRQGMLPSFGIIAERFTVMVFSEGTGPWTSPMTGETFKPSQAQPCAVLWPSSYELRSVLQENHVHFEMAAASVQAGFPWAPGVAGQLAPDETAAAGSLVAPPAADPGSRLGTSEDMVQTDLRELRRDGEAVLAPEELGRGAGPAVSALWFEGSWRVHALLDVLRQQMLGHPLPSSPPAPRRLPLLLAPAPFANASVKSAEVVKTQTTSAPASTAPTAAGSTSGDPAAGASHGVAELRGCFFPSQVRRFLELLRVLLPSFSCEFHLAHRHGAGANVFTQLGPRRIEAVSCECTGASPGKPADWKWEFRVGQ
ncbi:unnamed protein product [Polarella glacialis]|uniref:Uncharacterized protein n=1 Tax=Polarella glacialis TaxID=89957 RepID=A0A813DIB4_POLGL|nr:unnamed protein product [Polarella glacialis]